MSYNGITLCLEQLNQWEPKTINSLILRSSSQVQHRRSDPWTLWPCNLLVPPSQLSHAIYNLTKQVRRRVQPAVMGNSLKCGYGHDQHAGCHMVINSNCSLKLEQLGIVTRDMPFNSVHHHSCIWNIVPATYHSHRQEKVRFSCRLFNTPGSAMTIITISKHSLL